MMKRVSVKIRLTFYHNIPAKKQVFFLWIFHESSCLNMWPVAGKRTIQFCVLTSQHGFHVPQIQELMSPTVTNFLWQCYSFSVYSILLTILKIILFACPNKELSLWWIFSYLVSLIGGFENERFLTIITILQKLYILINYKLYILKTYFKRVKDLILLSR